LPEADLSFGNKLELVINIILHLSCLITYPCNSAYLTPTTSYKHSTAYYVLTTLWTRV